MLERLARDVHAIANRCAAVLPGGATIFDGLDAGNPAQHDHAYTALAQFTPWQDKIVAGQPMVVSLGAENKRIGTSFRSPANPTGVADRQTTRGFASLGWQG